MLAFGLVLVMLGLLEGSWVNSYLGPHIHPSERPEILRRSPLHSLFFSGLWIVLIFVGLVLIFLSSITAGIWITIVLFVLWFLGLHQFLAQIILSGSITAYSPHLVVVLGGLVGLLYGGLRGLILGVVMGFAATLLFGLLVNLVKGGLLPRKERRDLAMNFVTSHPELVRAAYPNLTGAKLVKAVEQAIETIFRKAIRDNNGLMDLEAGWTRDAIETATSSLIDQEPSNKGIPFRTKTTD